MNVLIHVGTVTFFNSLFELSTKLSHKNIKCLFVFDNLYDGYLKDIALLKDKGYEWLVYEEQMEKNNKKSGVGYFHRVYNKICYVRRKLDVFNAYNIFIEIKRLLKKKKTIECFINRHNITHLIMASDLIQYDTGLFIKLAKKRNIKTIVLPQFFANYKESGEHLFYDPNSHLTRRIYVLFENVFFLKKWVIRYRDKYLLRLPFYLIMARELLRIIPKNPWCINSGGADLVVVEGAAVKSLFLKEKLFNEDQIIVAGSINNDRLNHSIQNSLILKEELISHYNFDERKPIALVAVPPDMFYSRRLACEFDSYPEFLRLWMHGLKELDSSYNILLSLHPSFSSNDLEIISSYGFPIIDKATVYYLPLADLYVASISATIQWSIACGIPVLNYDVYRYKYDEYNAVQGVLYADNKEDYLKLIEFYSKLDNLKDLTDLQKRQSCEWGVLDGKFSERFYDLIVKN